MEWTKYTTKEALKDNDELMILDTDANANKRTLMDKIWDYVVDKMTTAVIAKLGTTNKTLIGAVNELNSNLGKKNTVDVGEAYLNENGYCLLTDRFPELSNANLITIAYYETIEPTAAISVYCSFYNAYVFGSKNTHITGLKIIYWK